MQNLHDLTEGDNSKMEKAIVELSKTILNNREIIRKSKIEIRRAKSIIKRAKREHDDFINALSTLDELAKLTNSMANV